MVMIRRFISALERYRKSKVISTEEDRRKKEREAVDKAWAESEIKRLNLCCSYCDFIMYDIMRRFEDMFIQDNDCFRDFYQLIEDGELPEFASREQTHDPDFEQGFQDYTEKLDREQFKKWALNEKVKRQRGNPAKCLVRPSTMSQSPALYV